MIETPTENKIIDKVWYKSLESGLLKRLKRDDSFWESL